MCRPSDIVPVGATESRFKVEKNKKPRYIMLETDINILNNPFYVYFLLFNELKLLEQHCVHFHSGLNCVRMLGERVCK